MRYQPVGFCLLVLAVLVTACDSRSSRRRSRDSEDRYESGSSSSSSSGSSSGGSVGGSSGGALIGTWNGTLRDAITDEQSPAKFIVASSGNPIYEYEAKGGSKQVELTSVGQQIRFVPPGGGVATVVVNALSVASDRISFGMNISMERTDSFGSSSTLSQSKIDLTCEMRLVGAEMEVEMSVAQEEILSQPGFVVPPSRQSATLRGKLTKS